VPRKRVSFVVTEPRSSERGQSADVPVPAHDAWIPPEYVPLQCKFAEALRDAAVLGGGWSRHH